MALRTFTLLLAAGAGLALYRMVQRPGATEGASPSPARGEADPTPTFGERLQNMQLANAGIGSAASDDHEDLLAPPTPEEQQSEDIKPGLPDFARGA
ncbi:MAG TPA: hypothetical protein VGD46_06925 [Rhizobacter sp.]